MFDSGAPINDAIRLVRVNPPTIVAPQSTWLRRWINTTVRSKGSVPTFARRLWLATLPVLFAVSGCEPSAGRVIERMKWTSQDGSTVIEAHLHKEGTIGNPAQGEHVRLYCTSNRLRERKVQVPDLPPGTWPIGWVYYVSKLGHIPKERVTVQSNDVIYGTFPGDFFITFDGCNTVLYWRSMGVKELELKSKKIQAGGYTFSVKPEISLFKSAKICQNGALVLSVDESYIENSEPLWAVSKDNAKTWSIVADRPACS